jgi:hypothetical protein
MRHIIPPVLAIANGGALETKLEFFVYRVITVVMQITHVMVIL